MKRSGEKGAALLTVLIALMIITLLLFEFQYAAMVERKLAYNDLNQTQAYYLAKSGARIGLLRIALYGRLKNNPQIRSMVPDPNMLNPFFNQIWQMTIPPFPPDAGSVKSLFKEDRDAAEKVLQETKIKEGQYSVTIKSESSKINLNTLIVPLAQLNQRPNFAVPPTRPDLYTGVMLLNLINGFIKESDDPTVEYPDLRPEELVMDMMDWVSPGDNRLAGGNKDGFYQQLTPPYRAKKNRFFTLDELRLVRGMNETLFQKLSPMVTVYGYQGKININTASDKMFRALYRDFTDDDIKRLTEYRTQTGGWMTENAFVDYVTNTLGRTAFKSIYTDASNYPFTTGTESFLIESLGMIQKSASSVQRTIKVAVALTAPPGGQILQGVSQADCTTVPGRTWNPSANSCMTNPRNQQECLNIAGTPMQSGNSMVCQINQYTGTAPISIPMSPTGTPATAGAGASGAPPAGGAAQAARPTALKILYWYET